MNNSPENRINMWAWWSRQKVVQYFLLIQDVYQINYSIPERRKLQKENIFKK